MARSPLLLSVAALLSLPAAAALPGIDGEELVRRVVASQRRSEAAFAGSTFDQREVKTTYDGSGRAKVESRLFYVLSGEGGEEGSRELVEVDGRPATAEERQKAAEEDAKARHKRIEKRAAQKASSPPQVSGDEDDPMVGGRKLSALAGLFVIDVVEQKIVDGRPVYVLSFRPRPGEPPKALGERALSSLAGTAIIDAADFQVRALEAHLVRPVKVAGGLAANVKDAIVSYQAQPARGRWFPCVVDLRLKGKTALLFRLDAGYRVEFANIRSFRVDAESEIGSSGRRAGASSP